MQKRRVIGNSPTSKRLSSSHTIMPCHLKMSLAVTGAINKLLKISIQMLGLSEYSKQQKKQADSKVWRKLLLLNYGCTLIDFDDHKTLLIYLLIKLLSVSEMYLEAKARAPLKGLKIQYPLC